MTQEFRLSKNIFMCAVIVGVTAVSTASATQHYSSNHVAHPTGKILGKSAPVLPRIDAPVSRALQPATRRAATRDLNKEIKQQILRRLRNGVYGRPHNYGGTLPYYSDARDAAIESAIENNTLNAGTLNIGQDEEVALTEYRTPVIVRPAANIINVTGEEKRIGEAKAARRADRFNREGDVSRIRFYRDNEAYDERFPSVVYLTARD